MTAPETPVAPVSWRTMVGVFGKIGVLSFGGPAGQIALMHRELVETRRWLDEQRFLHALNFCMVLPGPEAMQLATYAGWLMKGWRGGLVAGLLFILPGALLILALSLGYQVFGAVGAVEVAFFGLKAAVIALIAQALVRLAGRALGRPLHRVLAVLAFVAMSGFGVAFPLVVLAAGGLGAALSRGPVAVDSGTTLPPIGQTLGTIVLWLAIWLAPVAVVMGALGGDHVLSQVALFFSQMAVLTFGGAYAVLAWVAQAAVGGFGWMTPEAMLDGLALAETTPGPLILVTQFVGFMAGTQAGGLWLGVIAAVVTSWVTFAPCFLWIFAGAPYAEALRHRPGLSGALAAVTAAVVGVIAHLGLWFATHALFSQTRKIGAIEVPVWASLDGAALGLTALGMAAVFGVRVGPALLIAGAALAGLAVHAF